MMLVIVWAAKIRATMHDVYNLVIRKIDITYEPKFRSVEIFEKFNRIELKRVIKELNCNRESTTTDFHQKLIL